MTHLNPPSGIRPDIVDQGATATAREIIPAATVTNRRALGIDTAREFTVYGPELTRHIVITREVPRPLVDRAIRDAAHDLQRLALEAYDLDELIEQRISRELDDILRTVGYGAGPAQVWAEWTQRRNAAQARRG